MIHSGAARVQAAGGLRTLTFDSPQALMLASGEAVGPLTIAFETYGALNADCSNAVLVCHDLSADQFVASLNPATGRPAWWPHIVGPGRPIDTNRFFVVCANVLGGAMGTTGPAAIASDGQVWGLRFPAIVVADMVRAQAMLVEALGVDSLFMVIGAGFGGMQALQWASAYPRRVFACATIAAVARQSAQNIALFELGRQAILADPDWRNGAYAVHGVKPIKGAAVARMAARIAGAQAAALRAQSEAGRIGERLAFAAADRSGGDRFDANSFLYLTRAIDAFDLAADFGGELVNALRGAATRHGVFAFSSDWRYPVGESRAIARALMAAGVETAFVEIETEAGHDAYLRDEPAFEAALTGFVDAAANARGLALQASAP